MNALNLQANNLKCSRGERVLWQGINFSLTSGQLLQIMGTNGSGKTSLLRILTGLQSPAAGTVTWQGDPITQQLSIYHAALAFLGHQSAIKDELTVAEQLYFNRRSRQHNTEYWQWVCAELNLLKLQRQYCRSLSQGQRQSVAIATVILSGAPLWIFDEPFAALDDRIMSTVQQLFARHIQQFGLIILTTHRPLTLNSLPIKQLILE